MASIVLGVAGAAVGSLFGPMGAQIGYAVGSMLGGALTAETQKYEGARLTNLTVQSNTNGSPIHYGWGTFRTAGNIIWTSGFKETKKTETSGGKGGPEVESTTYSYSASLAVAIHDGEISAVRRIWANKKLVYDASNNNTGGVGSMASYIRIYKGEEYQNPDSLIQQYHGDYTPGFRGLAYVVFDDIPVGDFGNQIPQFEFEIIRSYSVLGSSDLEYKSFTESYPGTGNKLFVGHNPANNHLYVFLQESPITNWVHTYKINQSTFQVVAFKRWENIGLMQLTSAKPISFDSSGDIYFSNPGPSNNDLSFSKMNKDTLEIVTDRYSNYAPQDNPFSGMGGWPALWPKNSQTDYMFGATFYSGSTFTQSFKIDNGFLITDSGVLQKAGVTTTVNISPYYTNGFKEVCDYQNNVLYYPTYGNTNATTVYLGYYGGGSMPNAVTLFNDGTPHSVSSINVDNLRGKIYVTSTRDVSYPPGTNLVDVQRINLSNLTLEETITITVPTNWSITSKPIFNPDSNTLNFSASNINTTPLLDRVYEVNCANMTVAIKEELQADLGGSRFSMSDFTQNIKNTYSSVIGGVVFGSITGSRTGFIINRGARYGYGTYPLSELVKEICLEVGLKENEINITELQSIEVRGFQRPQQTTARQLLDTLSIYYNFDGVESNGILKFVLRGKQPIASIDYYELGAKFYSTTFDDSNIFKMQRIQESDLPKKLSIVYYDIAKDYEQNTQEAKRVINTTDNINTIQAPIVFTATEAKQIVDRIMYQTYISRDKFQFEVNNNYAYLEPTDVITLTKNNQTYYLRVIKVDESQGIIKLEAEAEQSTVYTQNGVGDTGVISEDVLKDYALTDFHILDIPIFDIADNNGGNYVVVAKSGEGLWRGASVYKASTVDGTYSSQETIYIDSTMGSVTSLYDSNHQLNTVDYTSYFVVQVNNELSSISYDELLNGGNIALIGNELIQFMNAELIAANTYKISGLLRGRWGTEQYIGTHFVTDRFILFNFYDSSVKRINKNDYMYGVEKYYKGITIRNAIDSSNPIAFTNNAVGLKPLAVVNVIGTRNGNNDLHVEFKKRVRGQAILNNTLDIVDPDGDFYEIDIIGGRTIYTNNLYFTYTATQQIEDFGSVQSNIQLKIYKMNNGYGRGFEKFVTL